MVGVGVACGGDFLAQNAQMRLDAVEGEVLSYDKTRAAKMGVFGAGCYALLLPPWYAFLDRKLGSTGGLGKVSVE